MKKKTEYILIGVFGTIGGLVVADIIYAWWKFTKEFTPKSR